MNALFWGSKFEAAYGGGVVGGGGGRLHMSVTLGSISSALTVFAERDSAHGAAVLVLSPPVVCNGLSGALLHAACVA